MSYRVEFSILKSIYNLREKFALTNLPEHTTRFREFVRYILHLQIFFQPMFFDNGVQCSWLPKCLLYISAGLLTNNWPRRCANLRNPTASMKRSTSLTINSRRIILTFLALVADANWHRVLSIWFVKAYRLALL